MKEGNQQELTPKPATEATEEEPEEGVEDSRLYSKWIKESSARIDAINDYQKSNGYPHNHEDIQLLKDKAVRPFYWFKKDMEDDQITPRQFLTISKIIQDQNDKSRFIKWAAEHDDIDLTKGTPMETIAQLSKEEASEFIGMIYR